MVSLAKENKTARSLKASSVLYVGVERAKDVSQREGKKMQDNFGGRGGERK